jgi:uncharacterized Zn finger protein
MPKEKTKLHRVFDLTWNDIEAWAGGKIVSRSQNYQRQGRVADLAVTDEGSLIAWVDGSARYATRVSMDEDSRPDSICTCPYGSDCKHEGAVVIEALDRSSLGTADKLTWALDAVLEDQFDLCEAFAEYLHRRHPQTAWRTR